MDSTESTNACERIIRSLDRGHTLMARSKVGIIVAV